MHEMLGAARWPSSLYSLDSDCTARCLSASARGACSHLGSHGRGFLLGAFWEQQHVSRRVDPAHPHERPCASEPEPCSWEGLGNGGPAFAPDKRFLICAYLLPSPFLSPLLNLSLFLSDSKGSMIMKKKYMFFIKFTAWYFSTGIIRTFC